jgi:hypothetical protein
MFRQDSAADAFNVEEVHDFMPQMGPMVGYAVSRRESCRNFLSKYYPWLREEE